MLLQFAYFGLKRKAKTKFYIVIGGLNVLTTGPLNGFGKRSSLKKPL